MSRYTEQARKASAFIVKPTLDELQKDILYLKELTYQFLENYQFSDTQVEYFAQYLSNPNHMLSATDEIANTVFKELGDFWTNQIYDTNLHFRAALLNKENYQAYVKSVSEARDDITRYFAPGLGMKLANEIEKRYPLGKNQVLTSKKESQKKEGFDIKQILENFDKLSEDDLN